MCRKQLENDSCSRDAKHAVLEHPITTMRRARHRRPPGCNYSASLTDFAPERAPKQAARTRHASCRKQAWQSNPEAKEEPMNQDILAGKWKQMRGQVKQWWGKLTDDDLDRIDGAMDKLAGTLQERYGWERDEVEREMKRRFEGYDAEMREQTRR
jgi:uncharacterized protein YjbJ (UPF0337 family)